MRSVLMICVVALTVACSGSADDVFVGVLESESRQNFGTDTPGEYRIEMVATLNGRYAATFYQNDEQFAKRELVSCPENTLDYFRDRAPGRAEVLCSDSDGGILNGALAYSENGIYVPAIKQKYIDNPRLVEQEGLKPGDPLLFERRHHKAKYYAHVKWGFYGFRKVSQ